MEEKEKNLFVVVFLIVCISKMKSASNIFLRCNPRTAHDRTVRLLKTDFGDPVPPAEFDDGKWPLGDWTGLDKAKIMTSMLI